MTPPAAGSQPEVATGYRKDMTAVRTNTFAVVTAWMFAAQNRPTRLPGNAIAILLFLVVVAHDESTTAALEGLRVPGLLPSQVIRVTSGSSL